MDSKLRFSLWFLPIFVAAFAAGYVAWFQLKAPTYELPTTNYQRPATSNQAPVTSNQLLDTSIWKTYHNEEYGFEVKYPNDWRVEFAQPPETFRTGQLILYLSPLTEEYPGGGATLGVNQGNTMAVLEDLKIDLKQVELTSETIAQIKWSIVVHQEKDGGLTFLTFITDRDGRVYTLGTREIKLRTFVRQILSTFKFLQ